MKPSAALAAQRTAVRSLAGRYPVANPRIFGSVLKGLDYDGSDLDLLVDALPGATLLDLSAFQMALETLLGVSVDVRTPGELPGRFRAQILAEAQPV